MEVSVLESSTTQLKVTVLLLLLGLLVVLTLMLEKLRLEPERVVTLG